MRSNANLVFYLGTLSPWGEVKKKNKDRAHVKAKDSLDPLSAESSSVSRNARGRGGPDGTRGARGRGTERGRGAGRGGKRGTTVNGTKEKSSIEQAPADDLGNQITLDSQPSEAHAAQQAESESARSGTNFEKAIPADSMASTAELPKPSSKLDGRSWASIFSKPAPAPTPPKVPPVATSFETLVEEAIVLPPTPADPDIPALPPPIPVEDILVEAPITPPASDMTSLEPPSIITPSKDELTESNVEQVLDTSGPPASATAASTIASTIASTTDPRSAGDTVPSHSSQQLSTSRPQLGGYATSAFKAAGLTGRSASFQRKILEQQEAVVMPGKHALDRTAVQFGSMGLNGTVEDMDVDSDREEAETRAQPPQHSPIAPRAALPPAPQQTLPSQPPVSETLPTPRQAPGLPSVPVAQQPITQQPSQPLEVDQGQQQQSQPSYSYNQFNRYPPTGQQEASAPAQKAYEPFGQQAPPAPTIPYDGYANTSQATSQSQAQAPVHLGSYSSAANDTSSYYTSDSQRNAYQNYYGNYGQSQQSPQEAGASQQRIGSAFGTTLGDQASHHAANQSHQHPQATRYIPAGDTQNSGNSTPNPAIAGQQQQSQPQQAHQMLQQQQAQGQAGSQHNAYLYGHPYYASPYHSAYMSQVSAHPYGRERPMFDDVRRYDEQYLTHNPQFGYGGNHGGYGGPFGGAAGGKQGMYGQPHQYGISPQQTSYDQHSSSAANLGGFAQQQSAPGREAAASGSLANYGRSGSAQQSESQPQYSGGAAGNYGNIPDVFARSGTGFPGQGQGLNQQVSQQSGANDDSTRGYGDSAKVPGGGPSPALGQPSVRPGSAMQGQTGLPPPQSQTQQSQQGYGGYPGLVNQHQMHQQHGQQASQYGVGPPGGGLGGHHGSATQQSHQGSGYGAYGTAAGSFGGSYYGGANNRGGWGGNYGAH